MPSAKRLLEDMTVKGPDPAQWSDEARAKRGASTLELIRFSRKEYECAVSAVDDGTFRLSWHDYGPNAWTEEYGTLALCLMRLAALDFASETDSFFTMDERQFVPAAIRFLETTSS